MIGKARLAEVETAQEHNFLGNKVYDLGCKYFIFFNVYVIGSVN